MGGKEMCEEEGGVEEEGVSPSLIFKGGKGVLLLLVFALVSIGRDMICFAVTYLIFII